MDEIMSLCIKYHQMKLSEQVARNCKATENYTNLAEGYKLDKILFDNQFKNVDNLLTTL